MSHKNELRHFGVADGLTIVVAIGIASNGAFAWRTSRRDNNSHAAKSYPD